MGSIKQQFIEDEQGKRIAVLLPIEQYDNMLEQLEELEDIKSYDSAKASDDEVPFDQVKEDPWQEMIKGVELFTPDFMEHRNQPFQSNRESFE